MKKLSPALEHEYYISINHMQRMYNEYYRHRHITWTHYFNSHPYSERIKYITSLRYRANK